MSITVGAGLLSGRTATLKANPNEEVGAVKLRAQIDLGVGMGRLVDLSGNNLDGSSAIKTVGL